MRLFNFYTVTVITVLSSAVLSIIGATLITSLVWCCAVIKIKRKFNAKNQKDLNNIKQHAELHTQSQLMGEIFT